VSREKVAVCHIASGDLWAGAEVQIATLLRNLAQREELRLSAILLNPGRLAQEIRSCGIDVRIIPESQKSFLAVFSEAARYLVPRGVRILHSHRYKENALAALLAHRCRIPFLVRTQHGLSERYVGFRHIKQRLIQRLDRFAAQWATDRVISVSSEMSRHLARRMNPQKIVTIPNGINPEEVRSDLSPREAKDRLGIPRDCWVLGTAGRLERVKRLDIFLEAAKLIQAHLPNTRFVIAGDGSEEAKLRALAQAYGLQNNVLFLGHRNDIYDVLRALDMLVLCSDHEGLPMVLLEALCLGVVVVARAVGGIPEVIQNGVNGILVDSSDPRSLADACVQASADRAQSQRLVEAGIKSVTEGFGAAKAADQVTRLYFSLCERT
jgi:glycosyltransferase involved in cell wall biosynthesis